MAQSSREVYDIFHLSLARCINTHVPAAYVTWRLVLQVQQTVVLHFPPHFQAHCKQMSIICTLSISYPTNSGLTHHANSLRVCLNAAATVPPLNAVQARLPMDWTLCG